MCHSAIEEQPGAPQSAIMNTSHTPGLTQFQTSVLIVKLPVGPGSHSALSCAPPRLPLHSPTSVLFLGEGEGWHAPRREAARVQDSRSWHPTLGRSAPAHQLAV